MLSNYPSLSPLHEPLTLNPVSPSFGIVNTVVPPPYTADDPQKLVKVIASHGKTGDTCEISYTNCKVVGNGSFGVVFQARLVQGSLDSNGDDDVAIKKVLQDKRFKVSLASRSKRGADSPLTFTRSRIENCRLCA